MNMNRRTVIKQFLFVSAGIAILPACYRTKDKASIELKNIQVGADQEKLLGEIAEAILPATETVGAKDISAHWFALKMIDDCYKKEDQQKFMQGLEQFEQSAKTKFGKSFSNCSPGQKESMLHEFESRKKPADESSFFYITMKNLTIRAYTTSQFYLTKIQVYKLVPGKFKGCVSVNSI